MKPSATFSDKLPAATSDDAVPRAIAEAVEAETGDRFFSSLARDSMRVTLDGAQKREVSFDLREYAATVHKAQGTTADRVLMSPPGMDRHLSYVGMGIAFIRVFNHQIPSRVVGRNRYSV